MNAFFHNIIFANNPTANKRKYDVFDDAWYNLLDENSKAKNASY